jgi:YVTN family beta-propeller protein
LLVPFAALGALASLGADCGTTNHEVQGHQDFTSPQANPIVLSADGATLYVANTTSNTVSVIPTANPAQASQVEVGVEPVGLALKPDGTQLWVANHVSDSVSVVDVAPASPSYLTVIQTIQDIDASNVSQFDEPVGVAFASNTKAYVALSSRNDIAIINASTYAVTGRIQITAQEPRAIAVRGGKLYVAAFESSNQTELSVCPGATPGPSGSQCTLDTQDIVNFVITSPNMPGEPVEIVADPDVPDRDLFVFNTSDESEFDVVTGIGTLLYGVAVDSNGNAFVSGTEARNDANGQIGENLIDLDNRMFFNEVARVSCGGGSCGTPTIFDLESATPPSFPADGEQLATPYGIAISDDDATVVGVAMGNSRLFTMNASTGAVLGRLDLNHGVPAAFGQQIPKGIALRSGPGGAPQTAYVLNTLENTVSVVNVSNPAAPVAVSKFAVGSDRTPDVVRKGRIAFANAFASSSGTFSCESCHPDSHTDQLLWRIGGACFFGACTGDDEVRSTMPIRGLKNTLPLHWDGTLGDPFGGTNGAWNGTPPQPTDCALGDADGDHDCFVDLVNESLAGVMCDQAGGCDVGPSGEPGHLSVQERDHMARFIASTVYPPPRSRRITDTLSSQAVDGFEDFFVDVSGGFPSDAGDALGVVTCADMDSGCHALPLGADDNSATLAGFDAPTMRGMTDRFLHFSIGITTADETLVFGSDNQTISILGFTLNYPGPSSPKFTYDPAKGYEEETSFQAAFLLFQPVYGSGAEPMFQMFEEASVGFSGALGKQVQLNQQSTVAGPTLTKTLSILNALQTADTRGSANLRGVGRRNGAPITLSYRGATNDYRNGDDTLIRTQAQLVSEAQAGTLNLMLTAALSSNFGNDAYRQPLLSVTTNGNGTSGTNPAIPFLPGGDPMQLIGIDVRSDATVFIDGAPVAATITCTNGGSFTPYCSSERITIDLANSSLPTGLRMLQVQNPKSALSVEMPICSGTITNCR